MIQVRAPDGTIIRFPDGTAPAQINTVMHQYHAQALAMADARREAAQNGYSGPGYAMMNGYAFNRLPDAQALGAAVRTGVANLFGQGPGYGMADAYHATKAQAQRELQTYAGNHPVAALAADVAGAAVNPASLAGGEWVAGAPGLLPAMARGAVVGGGVGGVAGGPKGAAIGAATGGVVPAVGAPAGKAAEVVGGVARNVRRAVGAAEPAPVARERLVAALAKDQKAGIDPADRLANWPGVSAPTLADVGGENVRALVRDAGSQGPARQALQTYRDQVAADLQDHALAITHRLTPGETRTPQQLAADLEATRAANAAQKYAGPYATPIQLEDPETLQSLRDPEGAQAINRAIAGARANMDYGAVADLQALKDIASGPTGDVPVWPTTGRALDRIQIAFGNRGAQLAQSGSNDIAAGMFKRKALVNALLDNVPELADARADYRGLSQQIAGVENGGLIGRAPPSTFGDLFSDASPDVLNAAGVGGRDALATAIGAPTEGAVGVLNRLSTNTNTGRNMALIFGPDATDAWRSGIQAEADRMSNANFMAPNTGSQTASKHADLIAGLLHGPHAIVGALKTVVAGGPLSDAERQAIVSPAIDELSPDLLMSLIMARRSAQGAPPGAYLAAPASAAAASATQ